VLSSIGTGVERVVGGVPSLSLGPAVKRKGQRSGGRRRYCGGKKSKFTPVPYLYYGAGVVEIVAVLHYPDRFCGRLPHGGTEWGGGYYNLATRP
jgi:hypothetical protein